MLGWRSLGRAVSGMGKRRTTSETVYVINPSPCCNGYGYLIEWDGWDDRPSGRIACHCPAGKRWSGKAA